jgi:hypothetical protein
MLCGNVVLPEGWSRPGGILACAHCGKGTVTRDCTGRPFHVRCLPPINAHALDGVNDGNGQVRRDHAKGRRQGTRKEGK